MGAAVKLFCTLIGEKVEPLRKRHPLKPLDAIIRRADSLLALELPFKR
jgi:hypothetical protein